MITEDKPSDQSEGNTNDSEDELPDLPTLEEETCENAWWLTALFPVSQNFFRDSVNKPFLESKRRDVRVQFAQNYSNFDWEKGVFGDEHQIRLGKSKISMWGGINREQVLDLIIINEQLNPTNYIDLILEPIIKEQKKDITFIHDAAIMHISRRVRSWFKTNGINVLVLPGQSADFNIMENVWCSFRTELEFMSYVKPTTHQQSLDLVKEAWSCVQALYSESYLDELYKSMEKRLKLCVRKNGHLIYNK